MWVAFLCLVKFVLFLCVYGEVNNSHAIHFELSGSGCCEPKWTLAIENAELRQ